MLKNTRRETMVDLAVAFGAGLIVGWNLLPQPAWVANLYAVVKSKITGK